MAPALQRQAEDLKKSQLEDKLAGKLGTRPRPSELVEQHILHGMFKLQMGVPLVISWILSKVDLNMRLFVVV